MREGTVPEAGLATSLSKHRTPARSYALEVKSGPDQGQKLGLGARTVLIGMAMLAAIVVSSFGMYYFIRQPDQGNSAKNEKIEENKGSPTTRVVPVDHRSPT